MGVSSIPAGDTFNMQMKKGLLEGKGNNPCQDNSTHLINSMYKYHFDKSNMEFGYSYPSVNSWVSRLYIQISVLQMSVVPRPASQGTVIKRALASPGLQCICRGS
jgi:hypothetical protein